MEEKLQSVILLIEQKQKITYGEKDVYDMLNQLKKEVQALIAPPAPSVLMINVNDAIDSETGLV